METQTQDPISGRVITDHDRRIALSLKKIWNAKKRSLNLNQTIAAQRLGFQHQGTVSQYLNAHSALNLPTILKFAKLLEVNPTEIDPRVGDVLVAYQRDGKKDITVLTASLEKTKQTVHVAASTEACLAFPVIDHELQPRAEKGDFLIIDPTAELAAGALVLVYNGPTQKKLGTLLSYAGRKVVVRVGTSLNHIPLEESGTVMKVEAIQPQCAINYRAE